MCFCVNGLSHVGSDPTNIIFLGDHDNENMSLREGVMIAYSFNLLGDADLLGKFFFCNCRICFTRNGRLVVVWHSFIVRNFVEDVWFWIHEPPRRFGFDGTLFGWFLSSALF